MVLVAPTVRALVAAGPADALFRCVAEGWDVLTTVGVFEPLDAGVLALRPDGAILHLTHTHTSVRCLGSVHLLPGSYGACRMPEGRGRLRKSRFSGPTDNTP